MYKYRHLFAQGWELEKKNVWLHFVFLLYLTEGLFRDEC